MGTWGLGVGLGDNPLGFGGWGHGDLGFRGGTWGQPFRFWGLGQAAPGGYIYIYVSFAFLCKCTISTKIILFLSKCIHQILYMLRTS